MTGTAILVLLNGSTLRLTQSDFEDQQHFNTYMELLGDDVASGEAVYGQDDSGDFVYIPAKSVSYLRGVLR